MPQTNNIEEAVSQVMAPFYEDSDNTHTFWDWYVIGGRFAGTKLQAGLDQEKLEKFYKEIQNKKVTISGVQCGKQELLPASQIPMVDEIWANYFPEYKGKACPIFNHSNDQYVNNCLYGDVIKLKDCPPESECSRIIFAGPDYKDKKIEARFMLSTDIWNGVNNQETNWDGKINSALTMLKKSYLKPERYPTDDSLVVTVDYHS